MLRSFSLFLLLALSTQAFASVPQSLQGTWIFDPDSTEKRLHEQELPVEPNEMLQWLKIASSFSVIMKYRFSGDEVTVGWLNSDVGLRYRFSSAKGNLLTYTRVTPTGRGPDQLFVLVEEDHHIRTYLPRELERKILYFKKTDPSSLPKSNQELLAKVNEWHTVFKRIMSYVNSLGKGGGEKGLNNERNFRLVSVPRYPYF